MGVLRADGWQLVVSPADKEGAFIPVGVKAHHSTAVQCIYCFVGNWTPWVALFPTPYTHTEISSCWKKTWSPVFGFSVKCLLHSWHHHASSHAVPKPPVPSWLTGHLSPSTTSILSPQCSFVPWIPSTHAGSTRMLCPVLCCGFLFVQWTDRGLFWLCEYRGLFYKPQPSFSGAPRVQI